ncbi:glycosyltransferase family 39 protein [Teredinibacter haidensis]|uniref:glycosyltransferase family 39 protein n=1 Tax=Teredinibacter haidensis TaxID=2731755 RepID=UPI000948A759|nr:glycosyltransferase family 39 protein [Teredinibacter haidensis]
MTAIYQYFKTLNSRHMALCQEAHEATWDSHRDNLIQLLCIASLLLLSAAGGYGIAGYHFAFDSINSLSALIPEALLHNITVFGDGSFLLALVLLFSAKNIRFHWLVFLAAIIGGIASNSLKDIFDLLRPPAVLDAGSFNLFGKGYKYHSFPSGHTLTAFLMATVLYYYSQKHWQKVVVLLAAFAVGLSRIWLGIHWPIDTLVGGALGIICGLAAITLTQRWHAGLSNKMHWFVLALLIIAPIMLLVEKNDYRLALPLLYITGLLALFKTLKHYFIPPTPESNVAIGSAQIKLPVIPVWARASTTFWVFLVLITAYRIAVLLQPHFSLFYDEAYYFHWSLNPDLGYYSKPPMVAWAILLSTSLFGNGVIAVKLMASILYGATAVVIYSTIKRYSSAVNALVGGLVFLTIPMIGFNSEFITTDAPLIFFWSLALAYSLKAIKTKKLTDWLLLGVFSGFGMLSKYTMGALPLAVFGFLLTSKSYRPLLLTAGPWLAAVTAGLIFSLNIYWNFSNNWVALHHTQEISQTSGKLFNFSSLAEFTATQFLIFGPICSYLLIKIVYSLIKQAKQAETTETVDRAQFHLLLWVMLVILGAISLQAFLSRAFPNWAGPWMVAATIILAMGWQSTYTAKRFYQYLSYGLALNLCLLSLFYHWPAALRWLDIEATAKNDPFHRVTGWPELGEALMPYVESHPDALLASDSRDLLAYLGYYGMPGKFKFARWNPDADKIRDYYDLKVNLRNWAGQEKQGFLFVSKNAPSEQITSRFEQAIPLGTLTAHPYKNEEKTVTISLMKGFKGYPEYE